MEKYTATTAAEETTDAKPELVAHVAKTLEGVSDELARDLVAGVYIHSLSRSRGARPNT